MKIYANQIYEMPMLIQYREPFLISMSFKWSIAAIVLLLSLTAVSSREIFGIRVPIGEFESGMPIGYFDTT